MGLKICSLGSGSTGNCIYVASESTALLVDVGISSSRVEKCLRLLPAAKEVGVLVTHSHSDHICQVPSFIKRNGGSVYCHYLTAAELKGKMSGQFVLSEFSTDDFVVGDIAVSPFRVSHDVPTCGFVFYNKGAKIALTTDLGYIGNSIMGKLMGCDLVFIESNHDEGMLAQNAKYSYWLKQRILSEKGHLSNAACAEAAVRLVSSGVKQLILGHLSKENNYPELAYETVAGALQAAGAEPNDFALEVAGPDRMSGLYEIV